MSGCGGRAGPAVRETDDIDAVACGWRSGQFFDLVVVVDEAVGISECF